MKKALLSIASLLFMSMIYGQDPIFMPSMSISSYGIVNSPVNEDVTKIIDDDTNTKFLDFELGDGMGFTVDLGGLSYIATSIELTTANDFEERDPTQFEVLGSNDGTNFTSIATGAIPCVSNRFFARTFNFANTNGYIHYRVNYTAACDPTGGTGIPSIQVAETQLYGTLLSINDFTLPTRFSVFPNPNDGSFTLNYSGSELLISATITDISGKIVKIINLGNFGGRINIGLTNIQTGMYFLRVEGTETSITKKILIR